VPPRLYRSRRGAMIGGVCAGMGDYLSVDPVFIRILFIVLALGPGFGVLLYLILWIVVPLEDTAGASWRDDIPRSGEEIAERARGMGDDLRRNLLQPHPQAGVLVGLTLIVIGAVYLLQQFDIGWLWWLDFNILWPLLLILGGGALLLRGARRE
jgi:phage shock protein C